MSIIKKNTGIVTIATKPKADKPVEKVTKAAIAQVSASSAPAPAVVVAPVKVGKAELAAKVSAKMKESGVAAPANLVELAITTLFATITEVMHEGHIANITGFGLFSAPLKEASLRHNPRNPEERIEVPAALVPKFKASKTLKDALKTK